MEVCASRLGRYGNACGCDAILRLENKNPSIRVRMEGLILKTTVYFAPAFGKGATFLSSADGAQILMLSTLPVSSKEPKPT